MAHVEEILAALKQSEKNSLTTDLLNQFSHIFLTTAKKARREIEGLIAEPRLEEAFKKLEPWLPFIPIKIRKDELNHRFILLKAKLRRNLSAHIAGKVSRDDYLLEENKRLEEFLVLTRDVFNEFSP